VLVFLLTKLLVILLKQNVRVPKSMEIGVLGVNGHNVLIPALMDNVLELGN